MSSGFIIPVEGSDNPNQTLVPKMFGAYIESISSSVAYGGQGASCQMSLVEDPENDVTITLPEVGTACFIKYGEFEYGGVFQRWTYKEDISGRKYNVILESPGGKILNGVNAILSSFEGTAYNEGSGYDKFNPSDNPNFTNQIKNVWNPYGHKENFAFGGRFGLANTNSAGFPARELLNTLELIGRGESNFGDRILYGESEYEIDFGELKEVPEFFRISGQTLSLNAIVSECAEILQYDYFAAIDTETSFLNLVKDLYGDDYESGGGVIPDPIANGLKILIKTIDKTEQPNPGAVAALVSEAKNNGTHVSSEVGQELSDEVTQRVVIGGPASRYFVADINDCFAIWGKLSATSYVLGSIVPVAYQPDAQVTVILDEMEGLGGNVASSLFGGFPSSYTATVDELRMARQSQESWQMFKVFQSIANGTYNQDPWCVGVDFTPDLLQQLASGRIGPIRLASTSLTSAQKAYNQNIQKYVQKIFSKVQEVANNFYGRMFLVPLLEEPGGISNNLKFIEEDLLEVSSWELTDSAWVSHKPVKDIGFYQSGRLVSTSVYELNGNYDYSPMGGDYAGWQTLPDFPFTDGIATTKGGKVEDKVFYLNGRPYMVFDAGVQVLNFDENTTPDSGLTYLAKKFFGIDIPPERYIAPGKQNTQIQIPPSVAYPKFLGIPQQSERYSWGPWYRFARYNGKSEVVFDTNLVPENFGSVQRMDAAAFDTANAGVAVIGANESGRVELAEIPEYNIAERFNSTGPYVTNMDVNIGIGGITTSYQFNTWTPNFGKLAKYNADRVSRIFKATLEALRRFREKNPKRGFKPISFPKTNSEKNAARLQANRTSNGFLLFGYNGLTQLEGNGCNLSDAFGLALPNINKTFGSSNDQQWTGFSTTPEKNVTLNPAFHKPDNLFGEKNGKFVNGGVGPTNRDLDPFFSEAVFGDASSMIQNVDFLAVMNKSQDGQTHDLQLKEANKVSPVSEVRGVALRGPLVLSGWGFDIANNPVPSVTNDVTSFDSNACVNRTGWKTGPVNLMWDDQRKIWTGGLEMLTGILDSDIVGPSNAENPTTFNVKVMRLQDSAGSGSVGITGETIQCKNRDPSLFQSLVENKDVFVMIIRINYEWLPFWVGCPEEEDEEDSSGGL
jgi:hypothetical protein